MTDEKARQVLKIFEEAGMRIELGAQYSVKGQIAQLLNGAEKLLSESLCVVCGKPDTHPSARGDETYDEPICEDCYNT